MYYLKKKQFKPAMIFCTALFLPSIIGLILANVLYFKIELLIALLSIIMLYLIMVLVFWKISIRKNHYLFIKNGQIELVFCHPIQGETKLELFFNQIKSIEYYRMTSLKSWLMLFSFVFPKCVYLTYMINGEEQTNFIGYMDYKDLQEIAQKYHIELIVY